MSSPYFTKCRSVVTRSGSQGITHNAPAASLRSKLTRRKATGQVSSGAVKVEEEEARISGNVYVGRPPFDEHTQSHTQHEHTQKNTTSFNF